MDDAKIIDLFRGDPSYEFGVCAKCRSERDLAWRGDQYLCGGCRDAQELCSHRPTLAVDGWNAYCSSCGETLG